jgi:hypothetical protein
MEDNMGIKDFFSILLSLFLFFSVASYSQTETVGNPSSIILKNLRASGGTRELRNVKILSFKTPAAIYTANSTGQLKVNYGFQDPVIFKILLINDQKVLCNSLDEVSTLEGFEKDRWITLGKLIGGCFTLKNFTGPWLYKGLKKMGLETYHLLTTSQGNLKVDVLVDSTSYLVKQMALQSKDTEGEFWAQTWEFGEYKKIQGIFLPSNFFFSQVGVKGTNTPRTQVITDISLNTTVEPDYFKNIKISIGKKFVKLGYLQGQVTGVFFYEEDMFCRIFTNWGAKDLMEAGFTKGDRIIVSSGDLEFKARFYRVENDVDDPSVYLPPNALFTHNSIRWPVFYFQFNELSPRERFNKFKANIKLMSVLHIRKMREGVKHD